MAGSAPRLARRPPSAPLHPTSPVHSSTSLVSCDDRFCRCNPSPSLLVPCVLPSLTKTRNGLFFGALLDLISVSVSFAQNLHRFEDTIHVVLQLDKAPPPVRRPRRLEASKHRSFLSYSHTIPIARMLSSTHYHCIQLHPSSRNGHAANMLVQKAKSRLVHGCTLATRCRLVERGRDQVDIVACHSHYRCQADARALVESSPSCLSLPMPTISVLFTRPSPQFTTFASFVLRHGRG